MESVSARLNSFKKSKRVKNPDKPSSTATLKWPHPSDFQANPETLAEAGFYYDPAYGDSDNVTCYICEKQLGGWEIDDDPFLLHWRKCGQHCCWASVRCGLVSEVDASGRFISLDKTRHPTHKAMEKARLETFSAGKGWIHDKVKGHGAHSTMMARAGFVYTPQQSGDDLATCLYCNTSLSGWDEEDDPMEEHRKRASKSDFPCAFFPTSEPSQSQSTKPPSKSQAKPPSRSTSRSKYQDMAMPTKTFDGEEDLNVEPAKTTKSGTKTPRKPRSTSSTTTRKSSAKTPKAKSRSTSRTGLKDVAEDEEEDDVQLEPPPTVKKKVRSRSKSVVRSDVQIEDDEDAVLQPPPTVKKKPRSKSRSAVKEVVELDDENDSQTEPPTTVKKKSRTHSKSVLKLEAEPEVANEEDEIRKPSRSKSRKPAEQIEDGAEEKAPPKPHTKSKAIVPPENEETSRKPSRSKAKSSVVPSLTEEEGPRKIARTKPNSKAPDSDREEISEANPSRPPSRHEEAPKPPAKTKHQRTASKSTAKAPIAVSEVESIDQDKFVTVVQPKKKASSKPKPPQPMEAADLFNGDVVMDSHDSAPSPLLSSKSASTAELPPLFVPKRVTASTATSKPPSQSTAGENPASKSKAASQAPEPMKVVEISSDEESDAPKSEKENEPTDSLQRSKENTHLPPKTQTSLQPSIPQPQFSTPPRPVSSQGKFRKKPIIVETVQSPEAARSTSPPPTKPENNGDMSMADVEPDLDQRMGGPAPSIPPRPTIPLAAPYGIVPNTTQPDYKRSPTPPSSSQNIPVVPQTQPPFMPPLSRLPFTPLYTLSEAELDMTVEEWIRYQMEVEFDKFRRDGERELQQFRKKAEDVRKIIEGL